MAIRATNLDGAIEAFHRAVSLGAAWQGPLERAFEASAGQMHLAAIRFAPRAGTHAPAVAWPPGRPRRRGPHAASAVVPVALRGRRLGTVIAHRTVHGPFTAAEYEALQRLATSIAAADHESRARLSEREELANALHDEIAPMLFIARLALDGFLEADERVVHAAELVERSERALREIVNSLSAPPRDLIDELGDRLAELEQRYRVPIGFSAPRVLAADPFTARALLRVAHEAVSNAVKHSAPKRIDVTLAQGADRFVLTVVNDGVARAPSNCDSGRGLASLRSELARLGGALELTFRATGARLDAWLPAR